MLPEQIPDYAADQRTEVRTVSVSVNDQSYAVTETTTLTQLLDKFAPGMTKGVAVAINDVVVARSGWLTRYLSDGDRVLIIQATQGG